MSERMYHDSDGNEVNLVTLCMREPGWAANIIGVKDKRIAELELERDRLHSDWSLEKERARLQTKALSDALCQLDSTDCTHRELSGRHCLVEKPCMRCKLEAQVQRLVQTLGQISSIARDAGYTPPESLGDRFALIKRYADGAVESVRPAKGGGEG